MKWRFVDRVTKFEPWSRIEGLKCISLEEYSLLKRFGRKGVVPVSLLIESCVDLGRWLVLSSSEFRTGAIVSEISDMTFGREVGMSDILTTSVTVERVSGEVLEAIGEATVLGTRVIHGRFALQLLPLESLLEPAEPQALWKELYGTA